MFIWKSYQKRWKMRKSYGVITIIENLHTYILLKLYFDTRVFLICLKDSVYRENNKCKNDYNFAVRWYFEIFWFSIYLKRGDKYLHIYKSCIKRWNKKTFFVTFLSSWNSFDLLVSTIHVNIYHSVNHFFAVCG